MKIHIPRLSALFAALCCAFVFASDAHAQTAFGVTVDNNLVRFNLSTPGATTTVGAIGVPVGETIVGIDFRPATNQLYALTIDASNTGRLYAINAAASTPTTTVTATPVGTLSVPLEGTQFGVDFNPVPDALRIVSNTGQNLRITMLSSATPVTNVDSTLNRAGVTPATGVFAAAYTNNDNDPATSTTLYALDATNDELALQSPPNAGTLNPVGPLGVNASDIGGFDILTTTSGGTTTNTGYAVLNPDGSLSSILYIISLVGGAATMVDMIGGSPLRSFAIAETATENLVIFAATTGNQLLRFSARTPGTIDATVAITGLTGTLVGIDFRPSSPSASNTRRLLYGLTNDGGTGRIYTIDLASGAATLVYTLTTALQGTLFGVDFNPVPDALRIVSDTGQNLRITMLPGAAAGSMTTTFTDTSLNNGGSPAATITGVTAAAYTNNDSNPATGTALYGINSEINTLVLQGTNPSSGTAGNPGNPNVGVITSVGALGVDADTVNGFDISSFTSSITGYAGFNAGGGTSLFRINLVTGEATAVGIITGGDNIVGLSIADLSPTAANGTVSGRVTNKNGAPLAGVTVTLRDNTSGGTPRRTVTDEQGRYSFSDVETNNLYTILVARRSFGFSPSNRTFGFDGDTTEVDFVAIPRGRVFERRRGATGRSATSPAIKN